LLLSLAPVVLLSFEYEDDGAGFELNRKAAKEIGLFGIGLENK
jgi:hypothetical protein